MTFMCRPVNKKTRLDRLVVERGLAPSRERARALILSGSVMVDDRVADKAGSLVFPDCDLRIKGGGNPYVSRGGLKLKGALETFGIEVDDMVVLDVGASTGGFTDCLLQEGARRVYALDVGYGQIAWKLRVDERVVLIERTNIRRFDPSILDDRIDLVTVDVSFISLKLVLPVLASFMGSGSRLLTLIKPQFEAGRTDVGKGGVVRDEAVRKRVVDGIVEYAGEIGFLVEGVCPSPLPGPAGNLEFFMYGQRKP